MPYWQPQPLYRGTKCKRVERADIVIQTKIHTFYTTQFADIRAVWRYQTDITNPVEDDFRRVQENLISHL